MKKLKNGYTKLDDNVSFSLMRTNPRLTTNVKLMYNGNDLYLESYSVNSALSANKYKAFRITGKNTYDKDVARFYSGLSSMIAFDVFQNYSNESISTSFDNQYETFYWSGAESINSNVYDEELGFVAPLYIKDKLPNYFVIFKVPGPANFNLNGEESASDSDSDITNDWKFDFKKDILDKATIIRSFDLRERTPLGRYIRNYISQSTYTKNPVYVDFSEKEIYYYGINYSCGGFTKAVESFEDALCNKDNTVQSADDWITDGFLRNNIIFPNIINIEFLFNDNETPDYRFGRYIGLYCNDIDEFEFNVGLECYNGVDEKEPIKMTTSTVLSRRHTEEPLKIYMDVVDNGAGQMDIMNYFNEIYKDIESVYYIKDKYEQLHKLAYVKDETLGCNTYFSNYKHNELKEQVIIDDCSDSDFDSMIIEPKNTNTGKKNTPNYVNCYVTDKSIDLADLCGIDNEKSYANVDRLNEYGYASIQFRLKKVPVRGSKIILRNMHYAYYDNLDSDSDSELNLDDTDFVNVTAVDRLPAGQFNNYMFSIGNVDTGESDSEVIESTIEDVVHSIVCAINGRDFDDRYFDAYYAGDNIIIKCHFQGQKLDSEVCADFNRTMLDAIELVSYNYREEGTNRFYFIGGSDMTTNTFLTSAHNAPLFMGGRYLKNIHNGVTKINTVSSYIDRSNEKKEHFEMNEKYVVVTENDDIYVSKTGQVEICDAFIPTIGRLSFFPVKDFDFDTYFSIYGVNTQTEAEYNHLKEYIESGRLSSYNVSPLMDDKNNNIRTEYDFYKENYIAELSTVSKVVPNINKWSMINGLDSMHNPYRLNASKIFGASNLSANMNVQYDGKIDEHVYDMPYVILDDYEFGDIEYLLGYDNYRYIKSKNTFGNIITEMSEMFKDTSHNYFSDYFEKNTYADGKTEDMIRYSIISYNNNIDACETFFNGVRFKFENKEKDTDIVKKSILLNGYKFAFAYVPYSKEYKNADAASCSGCIIRNDTYKFIVVLMFVYFGYMDKYGFNRLNCYACPLLTGKYDKDDSDYDSDSDYENDNSQYGEYIQLYVRVDDDTPIFNFIERDNIIIAQNEYAKSIIDEARKSSNSVTRIMIFNEETSKYYDFLNSENDFIIEGDSITVYKKLNHQIDGAFMNNNNTIIRLYFNDASIARSHYFTDMLNEYMSMYSIQKNIDLSNDGGNGIFGKRKYTESKIYDFNIYVEEPDKLYVYDLYTIKPEIVNNNKKSIVAGVQMYTKDINKLSLTYIQRYSGYYEPLTRDVLFYSSDLDNIYDKTIFNSSFTNVYGDFGMMKDLSLHKVSDNINLLSEIIQPYYPYIGECAIDYRDLNVFYSNWDFGYFSRYVGAQEYVEEAGTRSMKNNIAFFGSKYLNLPDKITLQDFNDIIDWNDEYLYNSNLTDAELMYKEVNNTELDFYIFVEKRLTRYLADKLSDEFKTFINPEYGYGTISDIEDDIIQYIKQNILKLYKIDSIIMWDKIERSSDNNARIENDYSTYIDCSDTQKNNAGLDKYDGFQMKTLNSNMFDRKIVYNMQNGCKETIAWSVIIKKI